MEHVYFIHAHPDDLIGGAALAFILKETGRFTVHVIDFSRGERGLAGKVEMAECGRMRTEEEKKACAKLGIEPVFLHEIDGEICAGRETCEELADLFRKEPPRAVVTHWPVDRHADHVQVGAATLNALRFAKQNPEVYFHHQTHQTLNMPFLRYVGFGQRIMDLKNDLIGCYVCQNAVEMASRKTAEARFFGWKAAAPFAEAFGSMEVPLSGKNRSLFDELPPVTE